MATTKKKGAVAEFGVFRGGTTAFIAKTLASLGYQTKIYGFDTFEGFLPRKSVLDLFYDKEYESTSYEEVNQYLKPYNVELIKGDISNTYIAIQGVPLMFSFFDTDVYTPTQDSLRICYDQTVKGGIIAFDHYYCDKKWLYTIGERIAVKQVLSEGNSFNLYGTGIFVKT